MAEKFSRWTDKQTGINPFVAATTTKASVSIGTKILSGAAVLLLGLPRMFLFILVATLHAAISLCFVTGILIAISAFLLALHFVSSNTTQMLLLSGGALAVLGVLLVLPAPLSSVPLFFRNAIDRILITVLLNIVGVSYSVQYAEAARIIGVRRYEELPPTPFSATAGDVILCNHTNILELNATGNVSVVPKSFFGALSYSTLSTPPVATVATPLTTVVSSAKKSGRPVVLFVEGVRSNGDGVLLFPTELLENISDTSIHFAGFLYNDKSGRPSPPCSVGNFVAHLFSLASTLNLPYPATLTYLSNVHVPKQGKSSAEKWRADVRNLFAKMLNKNMLNLGMKDYQSFCEYYNALARGDESKARQIADVRGKNI